MHESVPELPDPTPDELKGAEKIGPWTRLATREVYQNPWIRVREDRVLRPDGSPGIYGVVEYRNVGIAVVPVDAQGRVHLVGQYRYPLREYSWEIPEGGRPIPVTGEAAESDLEAAMRELREETGLIAGRWDDLGPMSLSNSVSNEMGHIFLARELSQGPAQPDPTEELRRKALPLEEAYRMAMEGEITDSLSIAGLARAWRFLIREGSVKATPVP